MIANTKLAIVAISATIASIFKNLFKTRITSLSMHFALDDFNLNLKLYIVKYFVKDFIDFFYFFIAFVNLKRYTNTMDIKEYIKLCCVKKNISNAELARLTNQTPQNFSQKMQRNSFQSSELEKIATALNCHLEIKFIDNTTGQPII